MELGDKGACAPAARDQIASFQKSIPPHRCICYPFMKRQPEETTSMCLDDNHDSLVLCPERGVRVTTSPPLTELFVIACPTSRPRTVGTAVAVPGVAVLPTLTVSRIPNCHFQAAGIPPRSITSSPRPAISTRTHRSVTHF